MVAMFCAGSVLASAAGAQPVNTDLPGQGVRINAEHERNKALVARIDRAASPAETLAALREGWKNPPATYRPHTRWWWPGNAVTKEGITWQLEQMKDKGLGGVEIMSFTKVYEKGNIEFDSPRFVEMAGYVVDECRRLGMEVSLSLGPGWNHGNSQVPEANRSKVLSYSEKDIPGGKVNLMLPLPRNPSYVRWNKKKLVAVVAVALGENGEPDVEHRVDLTGSVAGSNGWMPKPKLNLEARLPSGRWRLMVFWEAYSGQKCVAENFQPRSWVVDHLSSKAVREYAEYMGTKYRSAFGADFGQTVDSFFGDSFEVKQGFSYWTDGLLERFRREKGYDLRPYLPLLVYDGAPETPYVRYDVGRFLHELGMEGVISTLADYCGEAGVRMRQQPHYRFTTEIIEASGVLQQPETELTRRSFEPKAYPHKLTTSGAWLYPSREKKWVSCEAFTFVDTKYCTTMEEIKRGTDLFLRDGVTQFYNHGYFYSPEKEIAPSRDLLWMNRISHVNTWWPWYRGLADYQARAAFLSRQGRADADVLLYSPMPTLWSERAAFPCSGMRYLPFGKLPKILVANGYDFDCVNDDLLRNYSQIENGRLQINGYGYSVLILPRVRCLSPETLAVVERFVQDGGTVFALNTLPEISDGWNNHEERDAELAAIRDRLFAPSGGEKRVGDGFSYYLPRCDGFEYLKKWVPAAGEWKPTAPLSLAYRKFVRILKKRSTPDFEIADAPQSNGLTFRHTKIGDVDCWFICNLQPHARKTEVTLKTKGKIPQVWNAMDAGIRRLDRFKTAADGRIVVPVDLQPWASEFVLLSPGGGARSSAAPPMAERHSAKTVELGGKWNVSIDGIGGFETNLVLRSLRDLATVSGLRNFAGTATYRTEFKASDSVPSVVLDLGAVGDVATVLVNGEEAGKVWMQPYRIDISKQLKKGKNELEVVVANRLWNYAAALEEPRPIPKSLQGHYGANWNRKYNGWNSLQSLKQKHGDNRFPSGLMGPVRLMGYRQ